MDTKNLNKLKKIIKFCQENGIKRVKMDGFEVELEEKPQAAFATPQPLDSSNIVPKKQTLIPTEDDLLFWSVGGLQIPEDELPKS